MRTELKKAIIAWIFENLNVWQLENSCRNAFRQYVFTEEGNYCIGGEKVSEFIGKQIKLIQEDLG